MLQWSSVLLKELYNLDLAPKESWPKRGRTRNFGTVIKVLLGTKIFFKNLLENWCIKVPG